MNIHDTLFNWLQIQRVADARPNDRAAKDTADFFWTILHEDHGVESVSIRDPEAELLQVDVTIKGETETKQIPREWVWKLLEDIESNPKYNE